MLKQTKIIKFIFKTQEIHKQHTKKTVKNSNRKFEEVSNT